MFDEKELEELYEDFLGLDEDVFLESEVNVRQLDNDIMARDFDMSATKMPSNLNNNFLDDTGDKPDVSIQLDLLNQNFISLDISEFEKKLKSPVGISDLRATGETFLRPTSCLDKKVDEIDNELKEVDEKLISPSLSPEKNSFHRVGWTSDSLGLWHSGPSSLNLSQPYHKNAPHQDLSSSVTGPSQGPPPFSSLSSSTKRTYSHQQLGAKVEMVYNLLSMLDTDNREDMSKTFLAMSSSPESCHAMRQSGCLPLLIQLIHSSELDREVRNRAAEALHNIVHAQTDEKRRKREIRVLKLLQQVREYCDELRNDSEQTQAQESDKHPINATGTLMKLSFDAEHRQAICALGGLHAITDLIQVDHKFHGSTNNDPLCITLRRYAGMSLTNLTFGDGKNKALLCSFSKFLLALTDQLKSPSEDLRQVTASVLRNLSWRADSDSKQALRNVGAVTALTISAMEAKKESTLKSILSALWNLSAHCSLNKVDICSVPGALAFLVKMLKYKSTSNTLSIIENAGGILRNVSSHIAVREDYRQILRDNYCFEVLLEQLRSPSLTIVSNACGTLWNLSARCSEDQRRLWEMGATSMLRSLVQSKHKMISMGSSAALKNLLAANPNGNLLSHLDSTAKSLGLQNLPTLFVRKKRALEQELNITLAETCENIEPAAPSCDVNKPEDGLRAENALGPKRSESHDSVKSSQSDTVYELINQRVHANEDKSLENSNATLHDSLDGKLMSRRIQDQKLMKRYAISMIPTPTSKKINQDRINEKTREEKVVAEESNGIAPDAHVKEPAKTDLNQRIKKGIPVRKTIPKRITLEDDVSREHSSSSKLPDDQHCETGSLERVNQFIGDHVHSVDTLLNSNKTIIDLNRGENEEARTNEIKGSQSKCVRYDGEQKNVMYTKELISKAGLTNRMEMTNNNSHVHNKTNSKEVDDGFNVNSNGVEVRENSSGENEFPSRNQPFSPINNEALLFGHEENSEKITDLGSNVPLFRQNLKEYPKNFDERKESQFGLGCRETNLDGDKIESNENCHRELNPFDQKAGCGIIRDLQLLPQESEKRFTACGALQDCSNEIKKFPDMRPFETLNSGFHTSNNPVNQTGKPKPSSDLDETGGIPYSSTLTSKGHPLEKHNNVKVNESGSKTSGACLLPRFKVGSPMRDAEVLHMEARKVCGEIQKHRDFDMGCSLTSEISAVSCSSFMDSGDYSLFDSSSTDAINFDESDMVKPLAKIKHHSSSKSEAANGEPVSLPSLGSLKNYQAEALDLDNSVLSIASITSEINENYTKDQGGLTSCTKTYKADAQNEFPEDISGDATLVSRGDDDTLNMDLLDDDSSLHSQENLPLDTDTLQEDASNRIRTKLTPKEKRKTFHERYRTYTIRDFRSFNSKKMPEVITSNQDKADVESRKETEGVESCGQYDIPCDIERNNENVDEELNNLENSHFKRSHEPLQFSKSFDRVRDCVSEFVFDSRSLNDLLSIGPSERKELVDNAKLVAFSLKTAVHDWETELISDSETEEPLKSLDIDTATYTKAFRNRHQSRLSLQEPQNLQRSEDTCIEYSEKVGAKICIPKDKPEEASEELSKGIRGRRKPLYYSPQKNPLKNRGLSSSPSSAKTVPTAEAKNPSFQKNSRSPALHREGTFVKEDQKKHGTTQDRSCLRAPGKSRLVAPEGNSKAVGGRRPLSTQASKANDRRSDAESSQRRAFSAGAGSRTIGEGITNSKKSAPTCSAPQKMRNSSSSHNVKTGSSPVKLRNLDSQSGKCQSDASLNLVDSKDKVSPGKAKAKKEVVSRIAGLWKKVEETKKNKTIKDNRVWIGPEKSTTPNEALVLEKEEILHIPTRTIVHSHTCEAFTDETSSDFANQQRNSGNPEDVFHDGRTGERQKRGIISAVVTPYNYNPPVSTVTRTSFAEIDNFQKNSMKVTTV